MKCALVISYFGRFPNYFNLWLESSSYTNLDFLIFTDVNMEGYNLPANVHVRNTTFDKLKTRIQKSLKKPSVVLQDAYKLCDYKITYGIVFKEELKGYDYWGYCDVDLIWGNPFLNMEADNVYNYQRLFKRGHFCLYKNDEYSRNLYKRSDLDSFFKFPYAYRTKYDCHYDELCEWNDLICKDGKLVYEEERYADIDFRYFRFRLAERNDLLALSKQIYIWDKGHLFVYYIDKQRVKRKEVSYIHLQKRDMDIQSQIDFSKPVLIAPNVIKNLGEEKIDVSFIEKWSKNKAIWKRYINKKMKWTIRKIKNGGIPYKVNRFMYMIKGK